MHFNGERGNECDAMPPHGVRTDALISFPGFVSRANGEAKRCA